MVFRIGDSCSSNFILEKKRELGLISDDGLVKSLVRGIKILQLLSDRGPLTFEQIIAQTKIPRSSVFRLIKTLEASRYLERENSEGIDSWSLGLEIVTLAKAKLSQLNLTKRVRAIMENLAERTDLSVQLCVLHSGKVMYIDHVKKEKPLTLYAEVGSQLSINVCAPGMVLTAAFERKKLDRLLKNQILPKNTPNTPTDLKELRKILKKVARQGFAIDNQQNAMGIRCVSAPILDHNQCVIAALNVTGSLSDIPDERIPMLVEQVKTAAEEASKMMGDTVAVKKRNQPGVDGK